MSFSRRTLMLVASLSLVGLCTGCGGQSGVFLLEDHGRLTQVTNGVSCALADAASYRKVLRAEDRFFAFLSTEGEDAFLTVLLAAKDGRLLDRWRIQDRNITHALFLLDMSWLDADVDKFFVVMNVNPSTEVGVTVNARTGEANSYVGRGFAWSSKAKHIAYFMDPPHFGSPRDALGRVMIDGLPVADVPRGTGRQLIWRNDVVDVVFDCDGRAEHIYVNAPSPIRSAP